MNKKGMELPINVAIYMIIGLIVLVVVILIFQKTISKSDKKLDGVTDPFEIKSKCLSWENLKSTFTSYDDCVQKCTDSPDSYKEACFYS